MSVPALPSPLIVDPNPEFLRTLREDARADASPPLLAADGKAAQRLITDPMTDISAIFVNLDVDRGHSGPGGLSVIRSARAHRPGTPVFVIHDAPPSQPENELRRLSVQRLIPKPLTYARILELAQPALLFDPSIALAVARRNEDAVGAEIREDDSSFVLIRASDLASGSASCFDVYVRLGAGRFTKIVRAGEGFPGDRVRAWLAKGLSHFHLRRDAQVHYLRFCEHFVSTLLHAAPASPVELTVSQVMNHGEEVMSYLHRHGVNDASFGYAAGFVRNLGMLLARLGTGRRELLRDRFTGLVARDHAVATSVVAALIAAELGVKAASIVQVVGLAALLHDVGLLRLPPAVRHEDESRMSIEQRALYRTHSLLGAQMVRALRGIHPSTVQAIAQHHERKDGSGYPGRVSPERVSRLAEIVGLADEAVRLASDPRREPGLHFRAQVEKRVLPSFSPAVAEAFRAAFFPDASLESAPRRRRAA